MPRSFAVTRFDGTEVVSFTEAGETSPLGPANRYTGFGMTTGQGIFNEAQPAPIAYFAGADNNQAAETGYVGLSNQGTQEGWPDILFYGPGTWGFGNGPNSTNMITVGPLKAGDVAFLSTLPRQQRVVNMNNLTDTSFQKLLSGVYDTPIPGVATPDQVTLSQIPVSITGGTASSQIVMSLTPAQDSPGVTAPTATALIQALRGGNPLTAIQTAKAAATPQLIPSPKATLAVYDQYYTCIDPDCSARYVDLHLMDPRKDLPAGSLTLDGDDDLAEVAIQCDTIVVPVIYTQGNYSPWHPTDPGYRGPAASTSPTTNPNRASKPSPASSSATKHGSTGS
ncbi:hypothetical protein DKM27_24755 [Mycobacterium tuberculosis variant bovis]|nr:hypothetical protein DKM27_24755 [Mycobacterium tuberculosis variant bovis]